MSAALLALVTASGYGSADFLAARLFRLGRRWPTLIVSQLAATAATGAVVAARHGPLPGAAATAYGVVGGLCAAAALAALWRGLETGPMGVVAAICGVPLVPVAVGLLRGESLSGAQMAGVVCALAGIAAVSLRGPSTSVRPVTGAVLGLALLAMAGFGTMQVALARASLEDPAWAALLVRATMAAVLGALGVRASGAVSLRPVRVTMPACVGLLQAAGILAFAWASTVGYLSLIAVIAALAPLCTAVLARFVLGERLSRLQVLGVAAALSGTALPAAR